MPGIAAASDWPEHSPVIRIDRKKHSARVRFHRLLLRSLFAFRV